MIALDTHTLVWWVSDDSRLSAKARKTIAAEQRSKGRILISVISAWEVAMLVAKNRLVLSMDVDDWLAAVQDIDVVEMMPVSMRMAVASTRLPGTFHSMPIRLIA